MAVITISATGGNWNSTATWVGGVIPTTSDSVLGNATSGQLTINVAATCQFVDFTNYTSTLTMNANLTCSLAGGTSIFGSGMNFAGTVGILIFSNTHSITQNTTNRIPNFSITGAATRTFNTNIYVNNFTWSGPPLVNGGVAYISGNFYQASTLTLPTTSGSIGGTANYVLDGSGLIAGNFTISTITITSGATYNTFGSSCLLRNAATLIYEAGTPPTLFNIILNTQNISNSTYNLDIRRTGCNLFLINTSVNSSFGLETINLLSSPTFNIIGLYDISKNYTTDSKAPQFTFLGNSLNANELQLYPAFRTTSALTNPPTSSDFTYNSPTIVLDRLYTHTIGSLKLIGGGIPTKPVIKSNSPGNQVSINLTSKITSQIIDFDFTDVNAVGDEIVAINGTLINTTNITNVYPSGAGGETSSVFIS